MAPRSGTEAVKARHAAVDVRATKRWNAQRVEIAGPRFLSALRKIAAGHNDPRTLAAEIIEHYKEC